MEIKQTEVLVIGSGFGGSAPALRLSQAGLQVTLLEKGPDINPFKDFKQTQDPKYVTRYLKKVPGKNLSVTYAEGLGGGSGFYEMVSLRAPTQAFEQKDPKGYSYWPSDVNRLVLDQYYQRAEEMLNVHQIEPQNVPKSGLVFSMLMKKLGYSVERAPFAVKNCIGSGFCVTGCIYGAKQSLHFNYLPQAVEAGTEIHTEVDAQSIRLLNVHKGQEMGDIREIPYRYEVSCNRTGTRDEVKYQAKILILAGGTIGTAKLLLDSSQDLPHMSKEVGNNIAFNGGVKTMSLLPDWCPDGDMYTGRSVPGMISFEFLNSHGIMLESNKPMPLLAMAAARMNNNTGKSGPTFWGQNHLDLMKKFRNRMLVLCALGMTAPTGRLVRNGKSFKMEFKLTSEVRKYYKETRQLLESIIVRNGGKMIDVQLVDRLGQPHSDLHFATAHQLGSCRMSDSPERGVVNSWGQVFGYPGIYVTDGAAIPSSLAVNTSLTILANAERISDGMLRRYGLAEKTLVLNQG